jgi:hypothetical protein
MKKPRFRGAPGPSGNGTRLDNATNTKSGGSNQESSALAPAHTFDACRQAMLLSWRAALGSIAEPDRTEEVKSTISAMLILGQIHG